MSVLGVVAKGAVAVTVATTAILTSSAGPALADPVTGVKSLGGGALYNAGHALFLVKDLGGGAYWNVTTSSFFVLSTGFTVAIDTLVTGGDDGILLLATAANDGRNALLLVDGKVLLPVESVLNGF